MAMIRDRENSFAVKAGALSLLVHGLLLMLLILSFSWHNVAKPLQVAQVELWDSLPAPKVMTPPPTPEPPAPEPPKPELVKPEPPPPPEPKAEIQVKAKPPVEATPKPEKKPEPKPKPKISPKPDPSIKAKEDIKRLQQLMAEEDQQLQKDVLQKDAQQVAAARSAEEANRAAVAQAASSGAINDAMNKIRNKIYRYVNRQLCGSGKPMLEFSVSLIPTGELSGAPRLMKSSGIAACDQAMERAILQAQPLPLPPQPELFAQFRDLTLRFHPNEDPL